MVNGPLRIQQWGIQGSGPGFRPHPYFQTKLRPKGPEKIFLETWPPLISGSGDRPPRLLSEGLDPPLYNNIATTHPFLQSLCLPCSFCSRKFFSVFRVSKSSISQWTSSADETEYKLSDYLVQALAFRCLILVHLAFCCCLSFSTFFCQCFVWLCVMCGTLPLNMVIY